MALRLEKSVLAIPSFLQVGDLGCFLSPERRGTLIIAASGSIVLLLGRTQISLRL